MKKFLEFIWVLIEPVVSFIVGIALGALGLLWIFTGFGILIIFAPNILPTPEWVRWSVLAFDVLCIVMILYGAIKEAYEKVYKN
jgi:divalent metal cation (Fe/Co/Zn/Cd) transporter